MSQRPITSATDVHRSRTGHPAVLDLREHATTKAPSPAHLNGPQASASPQRHTNHHQIKIEHAKATPRSPMVAKFAVLSATDASATSPTAPSPQITHELAEPQPDPTLAPITASTTPAITLPPAGSSIRPTVAIAQPAPAIPVTLPAEGPTTEPNWRPHLGLAPRSGRIVTGLTAVAIFAGYIWLHNYPKLALDAANSRAGIEAALPAYVPANYNLAKTSTGPGLVTFDFANPNVSEILKIAQARTTWHPHSLLDNFVAKQADSYATVQGQGLTIFIFNQNQATWINHGLWYRIEGAGKLTREQILQIAYSM